MSCPCRAACGWNVPRTARPQDALAQSWCPRLSLRRSWPRRSPRSAPVPPPRRPAGRRRLGWRRSWLITGLTGRAEPCLWHAQARRSAARALVRADRAKHVPARCDTAYDIGSITKQFTAAAILKLQMMGRLGISDRIDRFIDGVPPDKRVITINDLLTMTSGLTDSLGGDYQPLSREQMLTEAMRSRLLSTPGSTWHYSNVSYSILAAIIEKASGLGYEQFLARYLFRPAGMRHTGYLLPHWRAGQVAVVCRPATDARRAAPSITHGPRTGPTGTYAATVASSAPPRTCCAGTARCFITPFSVTTPSASCSPRGYASTPLVIATPTAGRSLPARSGRLRRTTAAMAGRSPSSPDSCAKRHSSSGSATTPSRPAAGTCNKPRSV